MNEEVWRPRSRQSFPSRAGQHPLVGSVPCPALGEHPLKAEMQREGGDAQSFLLLVTSGSAEISRGCSLRKVKVPLGEHWRCWFMDCRAKIISHTTLAESLIPCMPCGEAELLPCPASWILQAPQDVPRVCSSLPKLVRVGVLLLCGELSEKLQPDRPHLFTLGFFTSHFLSLSELKGRFPSSQSDLHTSSTTRPEQEQSRALWGGSRAVWDVGRL